MAYLQNMHWTTDILFGVFVGLGLLCYGVYGLYKDWKGD